MMSAIELRSFNARGLRDSKKRRELFHYFHKREAGIILIQEAHCTKEIENLWRAEWGYTVLFSHGSSDARGVCILFKPNFFLEIHKVYSDENGRYLIVDITIGNMRLTLSNLYAPNEDQPKFFENIINIIENIPNDNRVIGGDFNLVLNLDLDKKGGRHQTHNKSQAVIHTWMEDTDLIDIWRVKNPNLFKFTWHKNNPNPIFCRLDFFLISFGISSLIKTCDIRPGFQSDHSMVTLSLLVGNAPRGPGYWKLNVSLLNDIEYVNKIKTTILETQELNPNVNPSLLWDTIKCRIRGETIKYASLKKKQRLNKIKELEQKLYVLENEMQGKNIETDEDLKQKIEEVKDNLNKEIEYKTNGARIRCKVKWYEEGEKSTKYFLNLEKRNYNNKIIGQLRLANNLVTEDKEQILKEEACFYKKLYSSRNPPDIKMEEFIPDINMVKKLSEEGKRKL